MKNIKRMLGLVIVLGLTVVMLTACDKFKEGAEYTAAEVYINDEKLTAENTAEGQEYAPAASMLNIIGAQKIRFNKDGTITTWTRQSPEGDWTENEREDSSNSWIKDGEIIKMFDADGGELEYIQIKIVGKKIEIKMIGESEEEKTLKVVYER